MKQITHLLLLFTAVGATFVSAFTEKDDKENTIPTELLQDTYFMAKLSVSTEYCTAVIITKRFLLTGASCLKRHNTSQMFVSTTSGIHTVKDVFFHSPNNSLSLVKLTKDIIFDSFTRPISLLMKNELNLHLRMELQGGKELLVIGYTDNINRENKTEILETFKRFRKPMIISEFALETIQTNLKYSTYNNGACLILNGKLAGFSDCSPFNGDFSGIPYYFNWISQNVGYENLEDAFLHTNP